MSNASSIPSKRPFWFGTTFWVVLVGALFLVSAYIAESLANYDQLTRQQYFFRMDFRYWSPDPAYQFWLIFVFLVVDAITFRLPRANATEAGKWRLRLETSIFTSKACLLILITYFFIDMCTPIRSRWFWWYPANLFLFAFFLEEWLYIYKTKNRTDFSREILNVRKWFLIMSLTIASELGIYHFLYFTGLISHLYNPLERWLGFGDYSSHMAALTFFLILVSLGITTFVIKEWLTAIWQLRKTNQKESIKQQESSHGKT